MDAMLKQNLIAALQNQPIANFSAEEVNAAAINGIFEAAGLSKDASIRELSRSIGAFDLVLEAIDEILPIKVQNTLGQFAEVRTFARDAEVVFKIDKIGTRRAKLTISKGSRAGIYKAARLGSKTFSLDTMTYTVAVYTTLEEILLGTVSLAEFFNNILEGFEEIVYKETFNALAAGSTIGYNGFGGAVQGSGVNQQANSTNPSITTTKANLGAALDQVIPVVKQYGQPVIFGSYDKLAAIYNPLAATPGHPNSVDSLDIRNYGFVQVYKGIKVVELPNYLVDETNSTWFYDTKYVFVIPTGAKPVKIALKGEMYIQKNQQATGGEKWEVHKIMGVGVAMANNYAVIEING